MRHTIKLSITAVLPTFCIGSSASAQCVPYVPLSVPTGHAAEGSRVGTSVDVHQGAGVLGSASGAQYLISRPDGGWDSIPVPVGKGAHPDDLFGVGVALDGSTLVVGASHDDSYAPDAGAVYVYDISEAFPVLEQQLGSLTPANRDWFGRVVAVDSGTVVVAAPGDDDAELDAGAVSVFVREDGFWVHQQTLTPPEPSPMDAFGTAVAIMGDTLVVGAPGDDTASANAGAVLVYQRSGSHWTLTQQITASDASIFDSFGQSLALSADRLVIGAWADDDGAPNAGAAYVYERAGSLWGSEQKLTSAFASSSDMLGASVAVEADLIIVGAVRADGGDVDSGEAVVFRQSGEGWVEVASIPGAMTDAYMGASVAMSSGIALLGSPFDGARGIDAGTALSYDLRTLVCPADVDLDCDIDVDDAITFLDGFDSTSAWADLAPPEEVHDFCDVMAFIERFTLGCP